MRIQFLGTGTSVGIPVIGCRCPVCCSTDPRNRRRRTSILVSADETYVLVDTPPDFREQALEFDIPRVDAVLFTHSHADHIFGFDDIRRYNTMQGGAIPAYASPGTLADLRRIFDYVEHEKQPGMYRPMIRFEAVSGPFEIGGIRVAPLPVVHGACEALGYLFEADGRRVGYIPDCHELPEATRAKLTGLDVMILDGLRERPHPTHLTVEQSVHLLQGIRARRSFLIHMCHDLDHGTLEQSLPAGVDVAWDGLALDLG